MHSFYSINLLINDDNLVISYVINAFVNWSSVIYKNIPTGD